MFGVYAPGHDVARLAYFGLYALQHRGQESAGIATCEGGHITTMRDSGLVSQVFDEEKLRALAGDMAIGHVRYSTTGGGSWENAQPVWRDDGRELALAHNGNLTNAVELWSELKEDGVAFRGTSDSEIIAALISSHEGRFVEDAVAAVMPRLEGAYSTVAMTKHAVVAFRDPHGVRPLSLGRLGQRFVVASESCAFDIVGAELLREVRPGEMVSLTERGLDTRQIVKAGRPAHCVFEHIYFSRPDSRLEGKVLQQVRGKMGEILWREAPVEADLVISVPDSGNPAAAGFARASGLPRDDGLIKNRYVARTFIQPGQELRKRGLRLKFNPLPEIVAGRRLVVVDDSIVRGNTTRQIVGMLRDAGAGEVHLRISAPPIRHPCHYGVDMSTREEMIAHERTIEEIADELGADSLAYLSMDGVYEAVGTRPEDHCDACFTGRYPLGDPEDANGKFAFGGSSPAARASAFDERSASSSSHPGPGRISRRSSTRCTGARGSRWSGSGRTSPARGRWSGRGTPASRRRSSPATSTRGATRGTRRSPSGSRRGALTSSCSPATCSCSPPPSSPASASASSTSTRRCCRPSRGSTRSARRSTPGSRRPA